MKHDINFKSGVFVCNHCGVEKVSQVYRTVKTMQDLIDKEQELNKELQLFMLAHTNCKYRSSN